MGQHLRFRWCRGLPVRAIGKILIVLLVIGLLVLLGYVGYVYVLPKWCALLFYTYCILGILIWAYGLIRVIVANRHSNWAEVLFKKIVAANKPLDVASRMNRFRDTIAAVALVIVGLIAWPVDAIHGVILGLKNEGKNLTVQDYGLLQAGDLADAYKSLYSLVVVLAILGLTLLGVDLKIYGPITLGLMIASASFRHVSYIVGTVSLPAKLRRSAANTYALFLLVAAADFSTLILGLTALELGGKRGSIRWPALVKTGRELLQGEGALWNVLKGTRPSVHQLIVAFVGLLFSLALLKVLTEFREFKRRDEDYVWLAKTANVLGNFSDSLRYMRNVKSRDAESLSVETVALLGVNQIDDAAAKVKSMLEHQGKPATESMIFTNMINAFLLPRMPHSVYLAVLKRGIESNVPDTIMQDGMGLVAQHKLQQQALALFAEAGPSFPLSMARIHLLVNEPMEALASLEAHPPAPDLDKLIGQVLVLNVRLMDERTTPQEDAETFSRFARETIPLMRKLINSPLEQVQRIAIFLEIQRVLSFARKLGEDRVEELRFLADSLANQEKDEEFKRAIAIIESQFE